MFPSIQEKLSTLYEELDGEDVGQRVLTRS